MVPSSARATVSLIRAPLSYEDTSTAEEDNGSGAASDVDSFLTGGEELDSASDRSEYLELEVPMPKARVSGDDDDFEEFAEDERDVEERGAQVDSAARSGGHVVDLGLEMDGVSLSLGSGSEGLEAKASVAQDEKGDAGVEVGVERAEGEEENEVEEGSFLGGAIDVYEDDEEVVYDREVVGGLSNIVEEPKGDAAGEVLEAINNGGVGVFVSEARQSVTEGSKHVSLVHDEVGNGGPDEMLEEKMVVLPDGTVSIEAKFGAFRADAAVVIGSEGAGLLLNSSEEPKHDAFKEELVSSGKGKKHAFMDTEGEPHFDEGEEKMDSTPSEQKFVVAGSTLELESSERKHIEDELNRGDSIDGRPASVEYEKDQEPAAGIGATNGSVGVDDRVVVKLGNGDEAIVSKKDKSSVVAEVNLVETVTNSISDRGYGISPEKLDITTENSEDLQIDKKDDERNNEAGEEEVKPDPSIDIVNKSTIVYDRVPMKMRYEDKELGVASQHGSAALELKQNMLPTDLTKDIDGLGTEYFDDLHDRRDVVDEGEDVNLNEVGEKVERQEDLITEGPGRIAIFECSDSVKQLLENLDGSASSSNSYAGSFQDLLNEIDSQVVTESDEVVTDEEGDGKELLDSGALTAFLKAATGTSPHGNANAIGSDAARIFSVNRPVRLGSSVPFLKPAVSHPTRSSLFPRPDTAYSGDDESTMDEEEKNLREKVEQVRVKFLRLIHRLGYSPEDNVATQVLYRLGLAEGIKCGRQVGHAFSIESAKQKALKLEEDLKEGLDFSCNILVLGKTGAGKSALINSIIGDKMISTNAFQPETTCIREVVGVINGIKICLIDTPGFSPFVMDQNSNGKILSSIKKHMKKCVPDIVLYVDRLDTPTRDFNDLPLLRSITSALGSSIWFNAIVALTHSASAPPDDPSGAPLNYDVFVAQRSHIVQHSIRQAAGEMRLMNPVALVENHSSCRNREGQSVLPNGTSWRPQLLLLCYSSKILSEANSLIKIKEKTPGKLFGSRLRFPPLPYLLSSLLQAWRYPKLPADQSGENVDSDLELEDLLDSDNEEDDMYDQLPSFKPLKKAQVARLTNEQRKAYFDEYDYRVKLLQKKQLKDELKRVKEMKREKDTRDEIYHGETADDYDQDAAPTAVPVSLPDMVLPPTFDCENPAYRYRILESTSQLLARPVLDTHGWDHDCGYDGVSLEENLAVAGQFPASAAVQITKDKKDFSVRLDSSISAKHGENGSSLAGIDIQSVGKQLTYVLRGETKFKNLRKNKTSAGISVTFSGEDVATGVKVEDQLSIGKRVNLVASTGAIRSQGNVAYGANLEARLQEKDYPIDQDSSTLGLSLVRWHKDLALGANLQSQFSIGRNSKMALRVQLNNKFSGQIAIRTSSSDELQIALVGILSMVMPILGSIWPGES